MLSNSDQLDKAIKDKAKNLKALAECGDAAKYMAMSQNEQQWKFWQDKLRQNIDNIDIEFIKKYLI